MTGGFYGLGRRGPAAGARIAARVLLCSAAFNAPLQAQTITQAWERAIAGEPAVLAARAGYRAATERTAQARAALFPQMEASVNQQDNRRRSTPDPNRFEVPQTSERYPTRTAQINITQPVWRPANWVSLTQARASEQQAAWQAQASEQDLQARFFTAWFDAMASRDSLLHAREQENATRQQFEVMRRGERLGQHSEVQAAEAQAKHEQAAAERLAAEAELDARIALLEQVTGPLPGFAPPVLHAGAAATVLRQLEPLAVWTERVGAENPAVRAAEEALAAAREEVRKQQVQYQPTLDLVTRHAHVLQGAGTSPGQSGYRSWEHSIGFQFTWPLFAGGATIARVREAQAMADRAEAELEAARRNAAAQVRQAWSAAYAGRARAEAADHAVRAAELALQAAITGQRTGVKTPLDELQAREQMAAVLRDQRKAHYDHVVALARLRSAGGQPAEDLLVQVEPLLSSGPPLAFLPPR
jgi:outer membrane protein